MIVGYRKCVFFLLLILISGCNRFQEISYTDDHPDFSPLLSRDGRFEYQFVLLQSNPDKLHHIKVFLVQDEFLEGKKAFIAYSDSTDRVKKLKTVQISLDEWEEIFSLINQKKPWLALDECNQKSYRHRSLFLKKGHECIDVVSTGGTFLTIAASEPERAYGMMMFCGSDKTCNGLVEIPEMVLKIAKR